MKRYVFSIKSTVFTLLFITPLHLVQAQSLTVDGSMTINQDLTIKGNLILPNGVAAANNLKSSDQQKQITELKEEVASLRRLICENKSLVTACSGVLNNENLYTYK